MRYLSGLRTIPSIVAGLMAVPAYLMLMLIALGMFVVMSRDGRRPRHPAKA